MNDETTAPGPTSAQVAAKGLVVVPNPQLNGEPLRSWDGVHDDFPPIKVAYGTPAVVTPPHITEYPVTVNGVVLFELAAGSTFIVPAAPSMPAGEVFDAWADGQHTYAPGATYTMGAAPVNLTVNYHWGPAPVNPPVVVPPNSGVAPAPLPFTKGETLIYQSDFTKPLGSEWGLYSGILEPGDWRAALSHLVQNKAAGTVSFLEYQDTTPSAAGNPDANHVDWVGAGMQLGGVDVVKLGQGVEFCVKGQAHPLIFQMGILFTRGPWPATGEVDIWEVADLGKSWSSIHYANPDGSGTQYQIGPEINDGNIHVFRVELDNVAMKINLFRDGVQYGSGALPPLPFGSDGFGFCFQVQPESASVPADPSVTAENPVAMTAYWVRTFALAA